MIEKSAREIEEVEIRKGATETRHTVMDTVRRTEVYVKEEKP